MFFDAFSSPGLIHWQKHEHILDTSAVLWGRRPALQFMPFCLHLNWYGYDGRSVTEQGAYQQFDAGNNLIGTGKYLVVWQKRTKGWRMLRDMFNADAMPKMK